MRKKKLSPLDWLLGIHGMSALFKIKTMGENLQRDHKTKIVFAEICLMADNGEVVYHTWSTKETNKTMGKLLKHLKKDGIEMSPEMLKELTIHNAFGCLVKVEKK